MSRRERLYHLHDILRQRRTPISRQALMEELGCSQATLYRLIAELRDHLGAPLEQDEDNRGFYYVTISWRVTLNCLDCGLAQKNCKRC